MTAPPDDASDAGSSSSCSSEEFVAEVRVSAHRSGPSERRLPSSPLASDAAVGFLYDQAMELHSGPGIGEHVEHPRRIVQIYATMEEDGLMGRCHILPPRPASDMELLLAHTSEHIHTVDSMWKNSGAKPNDACAFITGDIYVSDGTAAAARMASGCCVQAVESVLRGEVQAAVTVVRPPGHHAECARAQGFCFFNNVAVAARAALTHPDIKRVLILDWDVHHGNGVQEILYEDPNVLYISLHRDPKNFYPYTAGFIGEVGKGAGEGFNVNIPWPKGGVGDADYKAAFECIVGPVLNTFQPDLVIVAAGFDAARGDPLGGCNLSPAGYAAMTRFLVTRYAQGKVVLCLEGGYNTKVTADCFAACTRVLLEEHPNRPTPAPTAQPTASTASTTTHADITGHDHTSTTADSAAAAAAVAEALSQLSVAGRHSQANGPSTPDQKQALSQGGYDDSMQDRLAVTPGTTPPNLGRKATTSNPTTSAAVSHIETHGSTQPDSQQQSATATTGSPAAAAAPAANGVSSSQPTSPATATAAAVCGSVQASGAEGKQVGTDSKGSMTEAEADELINALESMSVAATTSNKQDTTMAGAATAAAAAVLDAVAAAAGSTPPPAAAAAPAEPASQQRASAGRGRGGRGGGRGGARTPGSTGSVAQSGGGGDVFVVEKPVKKTPSSDCYKTLKEVCAIQAPHWPVLAEEPFVERWTRYLEQLEA